LLETEIMKTSPEQLEFTDNPHFVHKKRPNPRGRGGDVKRGRQKRGSKLKPQPPAKKLI